MKFISYVEQDISLINFAHLWDILYRCNRQINSASMY